MIATCEKGWGIVPALASAPLLPLVAEADALPEVAVIYSEIMDPEHIKDSLLLAADSPGIGVFSWPDDRFIGQPWSYQVHVAWIQSWNAENRETECCEFIRNWATVENIQKALSR